MALFVLSNYSQWRKSVLNRELDNTWKRPDISRFLQDINDFVWGNLDKEVKNWTRKLTISLKLASLHLCPTSIFLSLYIAWKIWNGFHTPKMHFLKQTSTSRHQSLAQMKIYANIWIYCVNKSVNELLQQMEVLPIITCRVPFFFLHSFSPGGGVPYFDFSRDIPLEIWKWTHTNTN